MTVPKFLGKTATAATDELDTFPSPGISRVEFAGNELTSHCPVTNQPDFYRVLISYEPDQLCVESKALKLYLMTFRETSQYAEALCVQIAEHVFSVVQPLSIRVELQQQVRGGLTLSCIHRLGEDLS